MGERHEIVLLAPSLLGPVPETLADALSSAGDCAALTAVLSRARYQHQSATTPSGDAQLVDCMATHVGLSAQALPNAGPLAAIAQGLHAPKTYYQAAPVHLRADRDRVLLFAGEDLALSAEHAELICHDFNQLYKDDEISLHHYAGAWILSADASLGPPLPPLSRVAGRYLDAVLPTQASYQSWRQRLNEIQMFLHNHPVNTARASEGALVVNGFWFWGGGEPEPLEISAGLQLVADDPVAIGLAEAIGTQCESVQRPPASIHQPLALILWRDAENALLAGNAEGWVDSVMKFDRQWAPWLREQAVQHGNRVTLDTGYERFTTGSGLSWPAWLRRNRPIRHWIRTE